MHALLFWLCLAAAVYLAIGVLAAFYLLQTPYADNPVWTMVLLWPLYFFG